jgi:hypothetical protein
MSRTVGERHTPRAEYSDLPKDIQNMIANYYAAKQREKAEGPISKKFNAANHLKTAYKKAAAEATDERTKAALKAKKREFKEKKDKAQKEYVDTYRGLQARKLVLSNAKRNPSFPHAGARKHL